MSKLRELRTADEIREEVSRLIHEEREVKADQAKIIVPVPILAGPDSDGCKLDYVYVPRGCGRASECHSCSRRRCKTSLEPAGAIVSDWSFQASGRLPQCRDTGAPCEATRRTRFCMFNHRRGIATQVRCWLEERVSTRSRRNSRSAPERFKESKPRSREPYNRSPAALVSRI
jgi:hypothetical protein